LTLGLCDKARRGETAQQAGEKVEEVSFVNTTPRPSSSWREWC